MGYFKLKNLSFLLLLELNYSNFFYTRILRKYPLQRCLFTTNTLAPFLIRFEFPLIYVVYTFNFLESSENVYLSELLEIARWALDKTFYN